MSRIRAVHRLVVAALPCVAASVLATESLAQDPSSLEVGVKAAYLYKFTGYVDWPGLAPDGPITFGVIGDDDMANELARIVRNREPGARPATVVRLRAFETLPKLQVLFIGAAESDRLPALIRSAHGEPTLIVTDTEGALALGSMINFVMSERHMRFEIGLGAAKKRGIALSSRLLTVARNVSTRVP